MMPGNELDRLFVGARSVASGRAAHVAEAFDSVWMYLTKANSTAIECDAWLLNRSSAPAEPAEEPYRSQKAPPPLPARFVAPGGVRIIPSEAHWQLVWSEDGHAAAALLDGVPVGLVEAGRRRGYAAFALRGAEAWARAWDAVHYAALFHESASE
jgi:hypothetical protein